ncbi:MAG: hypothetical protein ACRD9R_19015 [Pyrinomonadaceae bacterium]
MKGLCAGLAARLLGTAVAVVAFGLTLTIPSPAQQPGVPGTAAPSAGTNDPFADVRERRQREAALRGVGVGRGKNPADPRHAQRNFEQARQDFEHLQVIRNQWADALAADQTLDYGRISDEAADLKKRAGRLKAFFAFPSPDGDGKNQANRVGVSPEQMKDALARLCEGIINFVESPVFKSPGVLEVQASEQAGRTLQSIIDLSVGIRKNAERLNKAAK